jgi:uncharacterized protein YabE (DUF348 family)
VAGTCEVWSAVSGSRSTRGADDGGPNHGASAWPSSFTGPARYSPQFNGADATDEHHAPPAYTEPYAPYAEAAGEYADTYAPDPYGYGEPAYVTQDYPQHGQDPRYDGYEQTAYEYSEYTETEYGYARSEEYGGAAAEWERTERRTQLLTEIRPPALAPDGRENDAWPAAVAELESEIGLPAQRGPEDRRARTPQRRPAARKVTWVGRAVQGLVLAGLLGGVTAYVAFEKTVNVSVDGSVRQIHSFAGTVGAALASADISTGSHDLVSPALGASLSDNSTVTVRYGRPVNVTVNGADSRVWVHATTVGGALQELGVRTQGARFVSVTASTPIGRSGSSFSVFTMRHVTFLVDGKTDQVDTTAATVGSAMGGAGITLANQDTASVPLGSMPTDGETVSILRITGTTEVKQVSIPYSVTKESDPGSYVGATTVVTSGVNGVAQVTYALQIINGVKQSPKEVSRTVTKQPVNEVEKVGTKALPTNVASLNWAALAQCESGGNPKSVDASGTYYGLYQFSISTWDSLGGSGLPSNASSSEQTTRAELLYQRSGAGQWPVCGHNLFS